MVCAVADVDKSLPTTGMDRRGIMFGSAAFVLAFHLPAQAQPRSKGPPAPKAAPIADASRQRFNAFLAVGSDDIVTAIIAQTEGGQGNSTGMPQVIAAELGADWDKMRVQFSTERRPEFINTKLYKGLVLTAGSSSVTLFYEPMRKAAAATREMFVAAAAERWGVTPGECDVENSKVIHRSSGRRFTFGELAEAAARQPVPQNPSLRKLSDMPLIGQPVQRLDAEAKSNGSARFGLDFQVPGMLWAAVRHGPVRGSSVVSLDAEAARKAPGVRLVTEIAQGVAAVADHYWQAVKALQLVRETYTPYPENQVSTRELAGLLRAGLDQPGDPSPQNHGDVPTAMASAAQVLGAEFTFPILYHSCLEPVSCTASVTSDSCEIWLSTKSPSLDGGFAAAALGIDPASVIVHNEYQGGDFGRRAGFEHVTEAVLLSKAAGRPVKVMWTRDEDIRNDQFRTSAIMRARLGLGQDGMPVAWDLRTASDGVWRQLFPWFYSEQRPLDLPLLTLVASSYPIPNEYGSYRVVPHPVRIGAFRGNSDQMNGYVLDVMIDEAAHAAGQDPVAYRLKLLAGDPRSAHVVRRAASLAGWGHAPAGRFQGISFIKSEFYATRIAVVVEVAKSSAGIRVTRAFAACDSGLAVNPLLCEHCIEGGIIFGLSNAMFEEVTLTDGAADQKNFDDYRLMRMNEAPHVQVEIISVGETPGSIGEIGTFPVGGALCNALFRANGVRYRAQPFAKNGVTFA
jgi:isoquinoline 1-oxidoreductase subunit beta